MKVAIYTLGCKVNQYDSENIRENFINSGFLVCSPKDDADIYVVNSCAVTAESVRKTRKAVNHFRNLHNDSIIAVTGCVPRAFPNECDNITGADIFVKEKSGYQIVKVVKEYVSKNKGVLSNKNENANKDLITDFGGHTRAFVKIQDGCDSFCSYCAIPFARGAPRSKTLKDLEKEIENLSAAGFKEIVLVGINLSSYGSDLGLNLSDAVKTVCDNEKIKRVRLSSLEPVGLSGDIIESFGKFKKFCPSFHISLQSGSDAVLERMNRRYTIGFYLDLVKKIRDAFPDSFLSTDVIAGFPRESEEEFLETLEFLKKVRFNKVHVFPYSKREGTKAAIAPGQIDPETKEKRAGELRAVCEKIQKEELKKYIGKTLDVLFLEPKNGYSEGLSKNGVPVRAEGYIEKGLERKCVITGTEKDRCTGKITP